MILVICIRKISSQQVFVCFFVCLGVGFFWICKKLTGIVVIVRWRRGFGIFQVWMFLSCYVLFGFFRNQGLSKGLSVSFLLGIIIQGVSVKGRVCYRQMERQCLGCFGFGGLILGGGFKSWVKGVWEYCFRRKKGVVVVYWFFYKFVGFYFLCRFCIFKYLVGFYYVFYFCVSVMLVFVGSW